MGDRVYLNIRFHKQDAEIVADCLGFESGIGVLEHVSEESDGGSVWLVVEQANYGLHEERAELAAKGVAFEGYHCTGGDYGPCVFCAIDGKMIEADAVESSGVTLVVLMDEDTGDFYADSLAAAQEYVRTLRKVRAYFRNPPPMESAVDTASQREAPGDVRARDAL